MSKIPYRLLCFIILTPIVVYAFQADTSWAFAIMYSLFLVGIILEFLLVSKNDGGK